MNAVEAVQLIAHALEKGFGTIGFTLKVGNAQVVKEPSIERALRRQNVTFEFCARFVHYRDGVVLGFNMSRMLSRLPFPGNRWQPNKLEFEVSEVARLCAIVGNLGVQPSCMDGAVEVLRQGTVQRLDLVLASRKHNEVLDTPVSMMHRMQVASVSGEDPGAFQTFRQALQGFRSAFRSKSDLKAVMLSSRYVIEEAPDATVVELLPQGSPQPPGPPPPPPAKWLGTQRPPTLSNMGRPPPTRAPYGPDKPKRDLSKMGPVYEQLSARERRNAFPELHFKEYEFRYGDDADYEDHGGDEDDDFVL